MAAAHSKPLSAWMLVRLFAGSARTAMTSGVSRSFTRPLEPSGRKIGSQYAESSFDSFASSCSSRLIDELFTQMKRAGCRFAGDGAQRAASRISYAVFCLKKKKKKQEKNDVAIKRNSIRRHHNEHTQDQHQRDNQQ